jgi:hypothetical protein
MIAIPDERVDQVLALANIYLTVNPIHLAIRFTPLLGQGNKPSVMTLHTKRKVGTR